MAEFSKGECSCKAVHVGYDELEIEYCPLHKAAPKMYEALTEIYEAELGADVLRILQPWFSKVANILDKAEGK